jgi:hypothetical protein
MDALKFLESTPSQKQAITALDFLEDRQGGADRFLPALEETGRIAMSSIAPLVAWPVSKAAGAIRSIYSGSSASGTEAEEESYRHMTDIYKPGTESGQKLLEVFGKVLGVPAGIAKELMELPLESWKATGAAKYIPTALAEFGSYVVAGKGAKAAREKVATAVEKPFKGVEGVLEPTEQTPLRPVSIPKENIRAEEFLESRDIAEKQPSLITAEAFLEERQMEVGNVPPQPEIVQHGATSEGKQSPLVSKQTQEPTSIKNAVVDLERADRGAEPLERPAFVRGKEWRDEVISKVDNGTLDTRTTVNQISDMIERGEKPPTLSDEWNYALLYDKKRLQNEWNKVQGKIDKGGDTVKLELEREKIESDILNNEKVTSATGTEQSHALSSRKEMMAED